jgi:outer membrane protein OmpA-like peptidoglycan-associated protein
MSGIFLDYNGPLTSDYLNYQEFSKGLSIGTHVFLTPSLNMSVNTSFVPQVSSPENNSDIDRPSMIDANSLVQFKMNNGRVLSEDAFFAPYLSTGLGLNSLRNKTAIYFPAAIGIRMRLSSNLNLNLESMYKQSIGRRYQHITHSVGIVFSVPTQQKDTPLPEEELESEEASPMIATKTVITRPERGIDTDKDGIPDVEDTCPDVMGLIQFGGCPPTVPDPKDGPIASNDAFGVDPASLEASQNETTQLERAGEETIKIDKEDAEFLDFAVQNIYFEPNSNELKPESYPTLDRIAEILEKYPDANLAITGHTDAVGDEKNNLVLSIKRAFQVKYYLVNEKGIRLSRISSDGYGEQKPISDNDSIEGRSLNRRVEFELAKSGSNHNM